MPCNHPQESPWAGQNDRILHVLRLPWKSHQNRSEIVPKMVPAANNRPVMNMLHGSKLGWGSAVKISGVGHPINACKISTFD